MQSAAMGVTAAQIELWKRMAEILEKQRPKAIPCHECGTPIPVKKIIVRDNKVLCEKCYEKLYLPQHTTKK